MENIPVTTVNSELISAGLNPNNPSMTSVDFANAMTKARQDQEAQEQAIARAKELTVQSQIQTQNEQGVQDAGINPLMESYLTPQQAVATLNLILQEKGIPVDKEKVQAFIDSLDGKPVQRQVVEEFANRLSGERTRTGQPAKFTTDMPIKIPSGKSAADLGLEDMHDADGNSVDDKAISDGQFIAHVPADGMYQVIYDNQSNVEKLIPGGKEPVDPNLKANAKGADTMQKEIQKLNTTLDQIIATNRRSGIVNTITRAKQGLSVIAVYMKSPTPANLKAVEADVASIMTGGIATGEAMQDAGYKNIISDLDKGLSYWTGKTNMVASLFTHVAPIAEIIPKLQQVLEELLNTATDTITKQVESERPAFENIPQDKWEEIRDAKLNTMTLSNSVSSALHPEGSSQSNSGNDDKKAALRKKLGL